MFIYAISATGRILISIAGTLQQYQWGVTLATYVIFITILTYHYLSKIGKCTLYYKKSSQNVRLLSKIPSIFSKVHYPNPLLCNGHLQTIAYSIQRHWYNSKFPLGYEHEYITLKDGGQTSFCWPTVKGVRIPLKDNCPLVIILAGLTGGTHDVYVYNTMNECVRNSIGCVLLNHRGCSGNKLTTPFIYCAGYTDDLDTAVAYMLEKYPNHCLYGVGYSLGANILCKYLGEKGDKCAIMGAVSFCNPIDLYEVELHMKRTFMGRIYKKQLGKHQIRKLKEHFSIFKDYFMKNYRTNLEKEVTKFKDNYDFDTVFTSKIFPYHTAYNYYRKGSCILKLDDIKVPCILVQAYDDPISSVFPYDEISENSNIILAVVPCGGHCGLYDGLLPKQWVGAPVVELIKALQSH
jgi:predicted alpha/beta-fold hydrolase